MTRVWGRVHNTDGTRTWKAYETSADTGDDMPNFIWLQNVLLLWLDESPFYSDWGVPVQQVLATQIFPDYYMSITQQRFSNYFTSCLITRLSSTYPEYQVSITMSNGQTINQTLSQAQT